MNVQHRRNRPREIDMKARVHTYVTIAMCALWAFQNECEAQPQALTFNNSQISFTYLDPRNTKSDVTVHKLLSSRVLEDLSQFLAPLRLPKRIWVRTKSCGMANSFYVPSEWAINI